MLCYAERLCFPPSSVTKSTAEGDFVVGVWVQVGAGAWLGTDAGTQWDAADILTLLLDVVPVITQSWAEVRTCWAGLMIYSCTGLCVGCVHSGRQLTGEVSSA